AANGVAPKDRRLIPVARPLHRLDPVGMAIQAGGDHRPVEMGILLLVARGEVPPPLLDVPTDRRLEEQAVALDQVADPLAAGSEHKLNLDLVPGNDASCRIPAHFALGHLAIASLLRVLPPVSLA